LRVSEGCKGCSRKWEMSTVPTGPLMEPTSKIPIHGTQLNHGTSSRYRSNAVWLVRPRNLTHIPGQIPPYSLEPMHPMFLQVAADTTVVLLARDGLGAVSAWAALVLIVTMALLLLVSIFVLYELRKLSRQLSSTAEVFGDRSRPLIDHMGGAVKNVEYISTVLRADVDRLRGSLDGLAEGVNSASGSMKDRIGDISALLDLAQAEAEDAVLDTAAKVRAFRTGVGFLKGRSSATTSSAPAAVEEDAAGHKKNAT